MGRLRRPYLPGGIFHLAARTLRRERLFTPQLRTIALNAIGEAVPHSGVRLLAAAIMPNHLHIVVQQGKPPLAALMQPLLRRLALQLQAAHGIEGPVFWRHYACQPCLDPRHARNAIVYTHLNPVRARLCDDPADFPWTSHTLYTHPRLPQSAREPQLDGIAEILDPAVALPLFANGADRSVECLADDYLGFVAQRLRLDGIRDADELQPDPLEAISRPDPESREMAWGSSLNPLFNSPLGSHLPSHPREAPVASPDIASIVRAALAAEAPGMSLGAIRRRGGGHARSAIRQTIILRLHIARHSNIEIARYLEISESEVSRVIRLNRPGF